MYALLMLNFSHKLTEIDVFSKKRQTIIQLIMKSHLGKEHHKGKLEPLR